MAKKVNPGKNPAEDKNHRCTLSPSNPIAEKKIMILRPVQPFNEHRVLRLPPSGKIIKIRTWNVRSLYQDGKLANVRKETKRLGMKILRISEHR